MSEARSESSSSSGLTGCDAEFEGQLHARGIRNLRRTDSRQPRDLQTFEETLRKPRESPQPRRTDHNNLINRRENVQNEVAVMSAIAPKILPIEKILDSDERSRCEKKAFMEQACIATPANCLDLRRPAPDFTFGWQRSAFDPLAISSLGVIAAPLNNQQNLVFPCVAVELKGPGRDLRVGNLQCEWDAANIIYAKQQLWDRSGCNQGLDVDDFYGTIHAVTFTITDQTISCGYHWAEELPTGSIEYLSKNVDTWALGSADFDYYNQYYRTVRNAVDYAYDESLEWTRKCITAIGQRMLPGDGSLPTPPVSRRHASGSPKKRKMADQTPVTVRPVANGTNSP